MTRRRKFGSIEELPSGKFRAYYRGPDGKRHKAPHTFFDPGDASSWLRSEQKLIEFGEWTAPASRNLSKEDKARTVGDWCKEWMEIRLTDTNPLEPSTAQDYWKALNTRILHSTGKAGYLRTVPLTQLSRRDVTAWWDAINVQFDGKTTNHNAYKRLKTIMTAAVRREMIPANPVDIPEASRRPKTKIKELPAKQVMQDIVDELDHSKPRVDGSHKLIAILTFFHGLRIGEVLGLRRQDVIIEGDSISFYIRGNAYRVPKQGMVRKDRPKTEAGYRLIPAFARFNDDIRWHLANRVGDSPDALLFTTGTGQLILDTSYRSILDRAKSRAGHDDVKITPHYGRVWLITTLAEAGMPIPAIGEYLGQRDLRTITEVYMRATEDRKKKVLDAVNAAFDTPPGVVSLDEKRKIKNKESTSKGA